MAGGSRGTRGRGRPGKKNSRSQPTKKRTHFSNTSMYNSDEEELVGVESDEGSHSKRVCTPGQLCSCAM